MNRRDFILSIAAAGGAAVLPAHAFGSDSLGKTLPLRKLFPGGPEVTCLGLGGFHIGWTTETLAQATIEAALEEGVRFFDNAETYGHGLSEERYGKFLVPKYRDKIFLMTKSDAVDAAGARKDIEDSLRRFGTDRMDLWQIHALESPEDVDKRFDGGVLDEALKARHEGKIRHIGITGHSSPYAHLRAIERTAGDRSPFATCQFPVNVVDAGAKHSFLAKTFPLAQQKGIGILAMKTLADGRFFRTKVAANNKVVWQAGKAVIPDALTISDCIHFALSLPISVLITGAEKPEYVREKAALVRSFAGMSEAQRTDLVRKVAVFATEGLVEYYKAKDLKG